MSRRLRKAGLVVIGFLSITTLLLPSILDSSQEKAPDHENMYRGKYLLLSAFPHSVVSKLKTTGRGEVHHIVGSANYKLRFMVDFEIHGEYIKLESCKAASTKANL